MDEELEKKELEVNENGTNDKKIQLNKSSNKTSIHKYFIILIVFVVFIGGGFLVTRLNNVSLGDTKNEKKNEVSKKDYNTKYSISGNGLDEFDLYFMKEHNDNKNSVYSPLSIKTALGMLSEGANGDSKGQIVSVIGDYKSKKYTNSKHMSFANAMFINNNYKNNIKDSYINNMKENYSAEVKYDSFNTPDIVNKWVDEKTFGQINKLYDDISTNNFVQVNALAIDMEWVDYFQKVDKIYHVSFAHRNFSTSIETLGDIPGRIMFNNKYIARSGPYTAVLNRYDIVKELGEENIRKTVGDEYNKWLEEDPCGYHGENVKSVEEFLERYMSEIDTDYEHVSSSTDFLMYNDGEVKAFAKDLKTYDGLTLQYVAIMPNKISLSDFIKDTSVENITKIISSLKDIKLENFNDRVITKVHGNMPFFSFDYELKLIEDLKKIGITDVFDINKADLSELTTAKGDTYISEMLQKANIELTNEGIRAAATTTFGGKGAAGCWFDYIYDVPVEEINMDFDKPFMYLIRNKSTGEVWFAGTVYEPTDFESYPR